MLLGNECFGIPGEKVAFKRKRDGVKQLSVDSFAPENVINICAVAMDVACKPRDRTLLSFQLLLNFFSYVHKTKERRETLPFLSPP